jgi:replication initiation protein RepC
MGEEEAAIVIAAILQRASMINSPGGYLRNLTEKARAGKFSAWPMVMALWRVSQGVRKRECARSMVQVVAVRGRTLEPGGTRS